MEWFKQTAGGCYLAYNATVVGDVQAGADTSFWFNAVVRGDVAPVRIGQRVNVQDNAVIHCDNGIANEIGDDVVIGHGAVVHGMAVGSGTLIGMAATVLGRSRIGKDCLIAAGAVVPPGLEVPDGMVVMGVPGRIIRTVNEAEMRYMRQLGGHYVELARRYIRGDFAARGISP